MSAHATLASTAVSAAARNPDQGHRVRLAVAYSIAIALICVLAVYGLNYYTLGAADRPFSPKHALLRPSGPIGVKLGMAGFGMFLIIFLYPLRKLWPWLGRQGLTRHWLDFHVLLGLAAPFVIAFHAAFKFRGFAGIAFWIMLAVSLSGVVGRYLYGQIPRSLSAAELTMKEVQENRERLAEQVKAQRLLSEKDLQSLLRLPSKQRVDALPMFVALAYMMLLDLAGWLRVAGLRRRSLSLSGKFTTAFGLLPIRNTPLELAIAAAREEAALTKKVLFLERSQQVFHLWHVIHKPFSYTFAVLALAHIAVALAMGYF